MPGAAVEVVAGAPPDAGFPVGRPAMTTWIAGAAGLSLILVAVALAAVGWGRSRWKAETLGLRADLEAARAAPEPSVHRGAEPDALPPPVRRYLRVVLDDGQRVIEAAELGHTGEFAFDGEGERWVPFRSRQISVVRRPGFVWDARMRVAPGVEVFVHDGYVAGRGLLHARVAGLWTVMEEATSPELAHGELMRWLAEAPWYPTVLLQGQGVLWEPVDDRSARATIADGGVEVTLTFSFGDDGLVERVHSGGRYRSTDDGFEQLPWEGRFWRYERWDGILIPLEGEVSWVMPDGPVPYWRATLETIEYEIAG